MSPAAREPREATPDARPCDGLPDPNRDHG